MDKLLHRIRGLAERGERITTEDCRALFDVHDLNEFSRLGRLMRERRYGREAFFRVADSVVYRGEHPGLFLSEVETVIPEESVEVLVKVEWGGEDSAAQWRDRFRQFGESSLPLTLSLTASFLARMAEDVGVSFAEIAQEIQALVPLFISGRDGLLFDETWRSEHGGEGISGEGWLAVHDALHQAGLRSEGGMVYHTSWSPDLYVHHLELIRLLQDKTEGFESFAPMAWRESSPTSPYLAIPTASTTLKVMTICRLFLDNIPHIVASPGLSDPELAYVALSYGADTVDPTIRTDDLSVREIDSSSDSAMGLPVLSEGDRRERNGVDLQVVEERIEEARFRPVPVLSSGERLELVRGEE